MIFKYFKGAKLFSEPKFCQSNYWLQTLLLDKKFLKYKNEILKITNNSNIATRPAWKILPSMLPYKHFPSDDVSCSSYLYDCIINLPSNM